MSENRLEEQLERIRRLTEQLAQVRSRAAELSDEVNRYRAMMKRAPLHEVRDFRSHSSIDHTPAHSENHGGPSTPRPSSRGRRR